MAQVIGFPMHRVTYRHRASMDIFGSYVRTEQTRQRWDWLLAGSLALAAILPILL